MKSPVETGGQLILHKAKTKENTKKYKDVEIEISRMWYLNTANITVIIGTLGVTEKNTAHALRKPQETCHYLRHKDLCS